MNRIFVAIGVLLAICSISGLSMVHLYQVQREGLAILEQMANDAESGHLQTAAKNAEDFCHLWDKAENSFMQIVRRDPLDQITSIAARLPVFAHCEERASFLALVQELRALLQDLWDDQLPTLHNVL